MLPGMNSAGRHGDRVLTAGIHLHPCPLVIRRINKKSYRSVYKIFKYQESLFT